MSPTLERLSATGKGDLIWQLLRREPVKLEHVIVWNRLLSRFHFERSTDPLQISALPPSLTDT
ncbi:MAG: hypothetical protein M1118_03135 [Chloroflexi bacterium]|nr:hypothetical protein [Chloroflexota bacterium]